VEHAPTGIYSVDADGVLRDVNPACEAILARPAGEIVGRKLSELVVPQDATTALDAMTRLASGAESRVRFDVRIPRPSGEPATAHVITAAIHDGAGVSGARGILVDVTERIRAETALRSSERMLAEAQRMARLGSWEQDLETGLGTWSEEGFRICGRDPAQGPFTMAEFYGLVHPDDHAWLDRSTAAALATGEQEEGEFRVRHPSGEYRYVWSSFQVELDADGRPRRMFGHVQDVTERKHTELELVRAKEEAEAANRAKSGFLSSMSHELRTPLNSVIGFAGVLRKNRSGNLTESDLRYLERIHANGRHLLGLINDVLDLSKIEAGKMEIERLPVSVAALVAETLDELAGAVGGKRVELRHEFTEETAPLETDPGKLKQVLINLMGNAIKFTDEGSVTIAVTADPRTGRPRRLEVRDTGVGIPPERLSEIFRAFEQGENGIGRRYGGTGLGLTISRSLCELMGYRLEVSSEPGVGSTFAVVFQSDAPADASPRPPEAQVPPQRHSPSAHAPHDGAPGDRLVLVIDDEADARTLLTHHLEDLGCRTVSASTGPQGLAMAREFRPDLITLDLLLPGTNGWEILRLLKADADLRDIPVVIVSVIAKENRGTLLGAVDLLEKPIEREELRMVLDRHLGHGAGRVLVLDGDPESRLRLTGALRDEGVEARAAASCDEALRLLGTSVADLLVVDLQGGGPEIFQLLHHLRNASEHRHLGVVAVTSRALSRRERRRLTQLALAVLPRDESLEAALARTIREAWRSRAPLSPGSSHTAREAA
jgi:PAS domain S-box-containing protein